MNANVKNEVPALRVETVVRARLGGKFVTPKTASGVATVAVASFAYRAALPPRRAPEYKLRPLVSRDRRMRNALAFGTFGGGKLAGATDEERRAVAMRKRDEENRL